MRQAALSEGPAAGGEWTTPEPGRLRFVGYLEDAGRQGVRACGPSYRLAMTLFAAAIVASRSASLCAADTKPASNADGAR